MGVIMKVIKSGKGQMVKFMTITGCLLLFWASFGLAEIFNSAVSVDNILMTQGIVRRVLPKKNMILVKIRKGEKIKIRVNQQTEYIDIISLEELKKVKPVIHVPDEAERLHAQQSQ